MMMNYWDRIYIEYKTKAIQSHSDYLLTLCSEIEQIPRPVVIEMIRLLVMQSLNHCWLNYFKARLDAADQINDRLNRELLDVAEIKLQIHKIEQYFEAGAKKKGKYLISEDTKLISKLNLKEFLILELDKNYEHT